MYIVSKLVPLKNAPNIISTNFFLHIIYIKAKKILFGSIPYIARYLSIYKKYNLPERKNKISDIFTQQNLEKLDYFFPFLLR